MKAISLELLADPIQLYATLEKVPIYIERAPMCRVAVQVEGESITQSGQVWDSKKPLGLGITDLRDAFLAVKSLAQAIDFLQICGPFLNADHEPQTVDWYEFQRWQGRAKSLMLGRGIKDSPRPRKRKPGEPSWHRRDVRADYGWFDSPELLPTRVRDRVMLRVACTTALETIGASIFIDRLIAGVEFRECPWCGKIFRGAKHGGHEKRYCVPDHSRRAAKQRAALGG